MKRRDFMKATAITGVSGVLNQKCSSKRKNLARPRAGFDVHPFVKNHPEAVFIHMTDVKSKRDTRDIRDAGYRLAKELIVPVSGGGYPHSTRIMVKPNWTAAQPQDGKPVYEKLGVNTDLNFVEGWVQGMKETGPQKYYIRECCCPVQWEDMGWREMTERNGIDLRDLSSMDIWELKKGRDLNFIKIPDGIVFNEVAYMAPMNESDTFLVNIAKFKAHGMGITASIKNLQGICAKAFHNFCTPPGRVLKRHDKRYHKYFQKDFETHVNALHTRHTKEEYPRWDRPGENGGIRMEQWCQRMLDSYSVTPTGLNMIEAIYGQDGNGFGIGPHDKLGPYGVTSRDYMSNMIIFGMDPFRIDIITHWLAGHEPGNFGLFHIGIERGFSDVLDPHDIPVYLWKDSMATREKLDNITRTPLVTYYLQRDYNGQKESRFHLCDEPFDYSSWKTGTQVSDCSPAIRELGRDVNNYAVVEVSLPERENVHMDVLNRNGEVIWRHFADNPEPGAHQVDPDIFRKPGIYTICVRGMGREVKKDIMTFT